MPDTPEYSIVIPCFNERQRLPGTLDSIKAYLAERGVQAEVIVADNGSTDGTGDWARGQAKAMPYLRVIDCRTNQGKGFAVREGMLAASGRYRIFMDADSATPIEEADRFWALMKEGRADVVIGSRKIGGAKIEAAQSGARRMAGDLFGLCSRLLVLTGIADTQCGFKAVTAVAAEQVFRPMTGFTAIFDVEMLVLAVKSGLRVAEVPVRWTHDEDSRITYNFARTLRIFMELLAIKWRQRLLLPARIRPIQL